MKRFLVVGLLVVFCISFCLTAIPETARADGIPENRGQPSEIPEGWEACDFFLTDCIYDGEVAIEAEYGFINISSSSYDTYCITNIPEGTGRFITAFDDDEVILNTIDFPVPTDEPYYYLCPPGTAKIAVAAGEKIVKPDGGTEGLIHSTDVPPTSPTMIRRKTTKTMSIMGDSISTFLAYQPAQYAVYYTGYMSGVSSAAQMWWAVVAREMGWQLSTVNAWSGSLVSTMREEDSAMCMERTEKMGDNGDPDVIIILGGVNDFLEDCPLGSWNGKSDIPMTAKSFRQAYAVMLDNLQLNWPLAKIYCCTLPVCEMDSIFGEPESNRGQYLHEFNDAIREIAQIFNCEVIELNACGINRYNLQTYMGDYREETGTGLHPNALGHDLMARKILQALK